MGYENTFWAGKEGDKVSALQKLIPMQGKVPNGRTTNRALEDWRMLQNMYYDIYNNGGCNWESKGAYAIRQLSKKYIKPMYPWGKENVCGCYGDRLMQYQIDNLERLADAVFQAACAEQGI
jgi:hypothetical protein